MTLLDFVSKLKTQNVNISVVDGDSEEVIIEFKSQGIAGVESDLSARLVKYWSIAYALYSTTITVTLEVPNNGL